MYSFNPSLKPQSYTPDSNTERPYVDSNGDYAIHPSQKELWNNPPQKLEEMTWQDLDAWLKQFNLPFGMLTFTCFIRLLVLNRRFRPSSHGRKP